MVLPAGFQIVAMIAREDVRDAFVSNRYQGLEALPPCSVVGTSSLRRESQIRARHPLLRIEPLRGNVQTRLRKLDEGDFDAVILAAAGLKRLGLHQRITCLLEPEESLPAVGQGALGIEICEDRDDLRELLHAFDDQQTRCCVDAERSMSRALGGSCTLPLGGYAQLAGDQVRLRGFVALPDGSRLIADELTMPYSSTVAEVIGSELARRLMELGAGEVLEALEELS